MIQKWFEMEKEIKRNYNNSVWIPIKAVKVINKTGKLGYNGYQEEFLKVSAHAFYKEYIDEINKYEFFDLDIMNSQKGHVYKETYYLAKEYLNIDGVTVGEHLVLDQHFNSKEKNIWHLNEDIVITLGLKREGDAWVKPNKAYEEIAKLSRDENGNPNLLEIKAYCLKDYLCARQMSVHLDYYRERCATMKKLIQLDWEENLIGYNVENVRWEGGVREIHEGGMPFDSEISMMRVQRCDVDTDEDVPVFNNQNPDLKTDIFTKKSKGEKLYSISGAFWKKEWIEPNDNSYIVAEKEEEPSVVFITDAKGTKENKRTLLQGSRWLWFKPDIINAILDIRGSFLSWYTKDTGSICISPDNNVHFGINSIGLINIYAKDIGQLPEWQQQIYAGYNVSPDGGVSEELLSSQMKTIPAETEASEKSLKKAISAVNLISKKEYNFEMFKEHTEAEAIIRSIHRFRSINKRGLLSLAKDLVRITIDRINTKEIKKMITPINNQIGSLKCLEKLLGIKIHETQASEVMKILFWMYELRLGDAHLPKGEIDGYLELMNIDKDLPYVKQGELMINKVSSCLFEIHNVIKNR